MIALLITIIVVIVIGYVAILLLGPDPGLARDRADAGVDCRGADLPDVLAPGGGRRASRHDQIAVSWPVLA